MSSGGSNITAPFSLTCAAVSGWYAVCAWLPQTKLPKYQREDRRGLGPRQGRARPRLYPAQSSCSGRTTDTAARSNLRALTGPQGMRSTQYRAWIWGVFYSRFWDPE